MTEAKTLSSIRAIKNVNDNTVFIYRAVRCPFDEYEISIERYNENDLCEISTVTAHFDSQCELDKLLLDMCKGRLEPCHLKNIIDDLE